MEGLIFGILQCPTVSGNVQGKSAEKMWERGCVSVEKIARVLARLASLAQTGENGGKCHTFAKEKSKERTEPRPKNSKNSQNPTQRTITVIPLYLEFAEEQINDDGICTSIYFE